MFQRLLGSNPGATPATGTPDITGETTAIRMIVARLEALPPERARHLAGFAYVMSRAAQADLQISDAETATMEAALREHGGLDEAQAVLVAEMAKLEARRNGATADYLVTREFAGIATHEEKLAVLRCCFLVAAADDSISAEEAHVVNEIARELDIDAHELNRIREGFVGQLSAIRAQRQLLQGG
jgi:uncharacterized tellurite resistance protein B-like protein